MADSIRLRKLTVKSILGFGTYAEASVGMLMASKHTRQYLRWVYYNSSKITFMDDILDDLRISEEYRISKPGTSKETFKKLKASFFEGMDDFSKMITNKYFEKYLQKRSNAIIKRQFESDGRQQKRNQGHG